MLEKIEGRDFRKRAAPVEYHGGRHPVRGSSKETDSQRDRLPPGEGGQLGRK